MQTYENRRGNKFNGICDICRKGVGEGLGYLSDQRNDAGKFTMIHVACKGQTPTPREHRRRVAAELRKLGWTVFCDEEREDVQ